jgi:hypothetical protein
MRSTRANGRRRGVVRAAVVALTGDDVALVAAEQALLARIRPAGE